MPDFSKSFNFPFEDKDWKTKLGIYFLIIISISTVGWGISFFVDFPVQIVLKTINGMFGGSNQYRFVSHITNMGVQILTGILTLPLSLYTSGYILETISNITFSQKRPIGEHGKIRDRIVFGLIRVLISLLSSIPTLLLSIIPILFAITAALLSQNFQAIALLFWVFLVITTVITALFGIFITPMIKYSMEYTYITTKNIRHILNIRNIGDTIQKNWMDFLLLFVVEISSGILISLSIITCCMVFLFQPAIITYVAFVTAHIKGSIYMNIKDKVNK